MSKKQEAEVEARLKEFWDDHKDFDSGWARSILERLTEIMGRYRGDCATLLHLEIPDTCRTTIVVPESCRVAANEDLSLEVAGLLGYNAVSFE